jgi:hypothetical protein
MDRSWYVETMSKTIFSLFKNYYNQLMKLEEIKADRNDLIAIEEAAVRSMFSQKVSEASPPSFPTSLKVS